MWIRFRVGGREFGKARSKQQVWAASVSRSVRCEDLRFIFFHGPFFYNCAAGHGNTLSLLLLIIQVPKPKFHVSSISLWRPGPDHVCPTIHHHTINHLPRASKHTSVYNVFLNCPGFHSITQVRWRQLYQLPSVPLAPIKPHNWWCLFVTIHSHNNLQHHTGAIQAAQSAAARTFGADQTWFLVNGCSVGIHAAVMAIARWEGLQEKTKMLVAVLTLVLYVR
jgi:hypothetical protein